MHVARGKNLEFVPASHEDQAQPGVLKRVLATADQLFRGQVQMVNWSRLPVGSSFRPHYHEDMQEVFVLINGEVDMSVDGQVVSLQGGDAILVDPKEIHEMHNRCDEAVEYIVFGISTQQGGQTVVVE